MNHKDKITKNLGGDRLGSGAKNDISLHNYNRSTHDLSRAWRSSMAPGTLIPFLCEVALPGDSWDITMESLVRTMPAIGPLFGSYKIQMDIFSCPMRLYNGLLHNNMTKIGMNMNQVKLPKVNLSTRAVNIGKVSTQINNSQVATDALINYLGIRGIADHVFGTGNNYENVTRKFNAVPILAYYDIYKNYYTNKQEEKGYIIKPDVTTEKAKMLQSTNLREYGRDANGRMFYYWTPMIDAQASYLPNNHGLTQTDTYQAFSDIISNNGIPIADQLIAIEVTNNFDLTSIHCILTNEATPTLTSEIPLLTVYPNAGFGENNNILELGLADSIYSAYNPGNQNFLWGLSYNAQNTTQSKIKLTSVPLEDIDKARIEILRATGLNVEFNLNTMSWEPYKTIHQTDSVGDTMNKYHMNGLAIKTYQSDLFNNWLKTEWIDGSNGINQITAIDTSSGSFTVDALNLANKVYNMLNRIAVSGGSYEDYIEAVYSTEAMRRAETPIYMGGMSNEIVFEEVVSTAETTTENQKNPLGSLAGKGTQTNNRGGNVEIKVTEPSYIIGLVSITPRLDYAQGNKWYMNLKTIDDLHKPALDGIGFQELITDNYRDWETASVAKLYDLI